MAAVRPDPDALLARVQREEVKAKRGKLTVFFGATAGVGKTYTMLEDARSRKSKGVDVVVGYVEPHGRAETEELLDAGIDVCTTVNVQHIESLNDIVAGITGVRMQETVPDAVFEKADEVVLIDTPPDELLSRLAAGKVYVPEQARNAVENFFRKGNLIALRELALRTTADRVDQAMREYREGHGIRATWAAGERILVAIGPDEQGERLVRAGKRMASALHAAWIAVYVETPDLLRLSQEKRNQRIALL